MASNKVFAFVLVLSLLFFSAFSVSTDCCNCKPKPTPAAPPPAASCPEDTLKLGVCAGLLGLTPIGSPPSGSKCCALLKGLVDLEAAACLCTAIKDNVLGINLDIPVTLSLLISACGKSVPPGFQCA
ncbi:hypothetical protein JCGZ_07147 [Jatropha curcas]|uniref:Bifunctional inhibitor/plant lipid transfer protein/seed storage helical domain-containing protein n=1 Tax=Jatropha curcas TaxID=180498 RepID=A0A067KBH9_JATCU|nr:14 kDa proline-rich protein DC2.15 [Jatropha curcas]KDP33576.1 hypothetical protein JCGZ_07147 [Jatropha curcas]